ncbi:MAG TPA: hypothetical protein VMV50_02510 [Candidatus Paceibacterota bacterium]|nr:hypothetical protein [Candidatus Paceibacterota bacterium]
MNHHKLREVAKVGAGLVIADLISVLWFSWAGILPMSLLGITWTAAMVPVILLFDAALLLLLIHLGWNMRLPVASPSERNLLVLAGFIFLIVALVHLARLLFDWHVLLGTIIVPMWISWAGVIIAGYLSYSCFHFARHKRR